MKNLYFAFFLILCFSCEQQSESESAKIEAAPEKSVEQEITIDYRMLNGQYEASYCEVDGRRGYKSFEISIDSSFVKISSIYHLNDDCSDVGYDRVYSYYDRMGESVEYRSSDYVDMMDDNYQACGMGSITLGIPYDIDGINCELSLENKPANFVYSTEESFVFDDVQFTLK